jgi:hypothetical protein
MQLKTFVISGLVASATAVQRCTAPGPTGEQLSVMKQMQTEEQAHLLATGGQMNAEATIAANVYFHVVAAGQTEALGYISVRQLPV